MLRTYDISGKQVKVQSVFEHEGFKISCSTIMGNVPEIRVFDKDHNDVTQRMMPLEQSDTIVATAQNVARVVAGINHYLLITR